MSNLATDLAAENIESLDQLKEYWSSWTDGGYWCAGLSPDGIKIAFCPQPPSRHGGAWEIEEHAVAIRAKASKEVSLSFSNLSGIVNRSRLMPALIKEIERLQPIAALWGPTAAERDKLKADKAELLDALTYLAGECHVEMDEDYNPHARPLANALAVLAKHRED